MLTAFFNSFFEQKTGECESEEDVVKFYTSYYLQNFIHFCIYKYQTRLNLARMNTDAQQDQSANMASVLLKQEVEVAWK